MQRFLRRVGENVVVLDDLSGGFTENIVHEDIIFMHGSINDVALVNDLFRKYHFDYVYHLAAYAAVGLSHFIKSFNYANNLMGSINLINAAVNHDVKVFVFTSSNAVYGRSQLPMTEDLTPVPEDPYGIAKYAVELDLAESHEMFGMNYIIFRPHNVYGERQNIGDPYRNVIGIFMNQIMQGQPLTIFGDGLQTRAFSYISDVAPAIAHSVERKACFNKVFNVGADKAHTVLELAKIVSIAMDAELKIAHLEPRNEIVHAFSSHDRIKAVLGELIGDITLEDGVNRMAKWAQQAGARESKIVSTLEVYKNLPPSWRRLIS